MLVEIDEFFVQKMTPPEHQHGEGALQQVRYAAAALLVVCAKSDFHDHPEEEKAIHRLLEQTFELDHQMIVDLLSYVDAATSAQRLQEFTQLVNKYYVAEDKAVLIENLWQVAFADGRLDRFEELYVGRVAFMIAVSSDVVAQARAKVAATQG